MKSVVFEYWLFKCPFTCCKTAVSDWFILFQFHAHENCMPFFIFSRGIFYNFYARITNYLNMLNTCVALEMTFLEMTVLSLNITSFLSVSDKLFKSIILHNFGFHGHNLNLSIPAQAGLHQFQVNYSTCLLMFTRRWITVRYALGKCQIKKTDNHGLTPIVLTLALKIRAFLCSSIARRRSMAAASL